MGIDRSFDPHKPVMNNWEYEDKKSLDFYFFLQEINKELVETAA